MEVAAYVNGVSDKKLKAAEEKYGNDCRFSFHHAEDEGDCNVVAIKSYDAPALEYALRIFEGEGDIHLMVDKTTIYSGHLKDLQAGIENYSAAKYSFYYGAVDFTQETLEELISAVRELCDAVVEIKRVSSNEVIVTLIEPDFPRGIDFSDLYDQTGFHCEFKAHIENPVFKGVTFQ